jgi:hypothetical protein
MMCSGPESDLIEAAAIGDQSAARTNRKSKANRVRPAFFALMRREQVVVAGAAT